MIIRYLENELLLRMGTIMRRVLSSKDSISKGEFIRRGIDGINNSLDDEKNICHHCKFKGDKSLFYSCTNRSSSHKFNLNDDLIKELLNMKSNYSYHCQKKYCIYCVKNCYHTKLKKSEKKNWLCPFCIVS